MKRFWVGDLKIGKLRTFLIIAKALEEISQNGRRG